MKKSVILSMVIIVLALSAMTASARDDKISIADISTEHREIKEPLIIAPNTNIEIVRENGKGGEERTKPINNIKNNLEDIENGYKDPLIILGSQVSKDGSNDFSKKPKLPVLIIIAIIGLLAIKMVCSIRKK